VKEIVDDERQISFSHSHNDEVSWDKFLQDKSDVLSVKL